MQTLVSQVRVNPDFHLSCTLLLLKVSCSELTLTETNLTLPFTTLYPSTSTYVLKMTRSHSIIKSTHSVSSTSTFKSFTCTTRLNGMHDRGLNPRLLTNTLYSIMLSNLGIKSGSGKVDCISLLLINLCEAASQSWTSFSFVLMYCNVDC